MANQRPIRRGKIPFRRGSRRPKRWAASSNGYNVDPGTTGLFGSVIPDEFALDPAGVPPIDSLLAGEFDVEPWADEQEIRLDRIVGGISIAGAVTQLGTNAPVPIVVRLGLIVAEDVSDDPTAPDPTRKLFDQTDLQEAEWMWLHQLVLRPDAAVAVNLQRDYAENLHVDIRNRRKIGQKDHLFLYASYATDLTYDGLISVFNVRVYHSLRMIMVSK